MAAIYDVGVRKKKVEGNGYSKKDGCLMNCIVCERPAHGMCRFCGRALCQDHFKEKNFILDVASKEGSKLSVLAVEKALFCGKCNPIEELVEIEIQSNKSPSIPNGEFPTEEEILRSSQGKQPEVTRQIRGLPPNAPIAVVNGRIIGNIDEDGPKPWAV